MEVNFPRPIDKIVSAASPSATPSRQPLKNVHAGLDGVADFRPYGTPVIFVGTAAVSAASRRLDVTAPLYTKKVEEAARATTIGKALPYTPTENKGGLKGPSFLQGSQPCRGTAAKASVSDTTP